LSRAADAGIRVPDADPHPIMKLEPTLDLAELDQAMDSGSRR